MNEIVNGDRYQDTAYQVLELRHFFIKTYLLDQTIMTEMTKNTTSPGMFEEALKQIGYLKSIEQAPFAKNVKVLVTGYKNEYMNQIEWNIKDANVASDEYTTLKKFLRNVDPKFKTSTDPTTQARLAAIKQEIEDGIAGK